MFAAQPDRDLVGITHALSNMGHVATVRTGRKEAEDRAGGESVFAALKHSFVYLKAFVDGKVCAGRHCSLNLH